MSSRSLTRWPILPSKRARRRTRLRDRRYAKVLHGLRLTPICSNGSMSGQGTRPRCAEAEFRVHTALCPRPGEEIVNFAQAPALPTGRLRLLCQMASRTTLGRGCGVIRCHSRIGGPRNRPADASIEQEAGEKPEKKILLPSLRQIPFQFFRIELAAFRSHYA